MLLKKYNILVNGIMFSLTFKDNLTLIDGKSGVGKTMLFKQIRNDALVNSRDFLCLDANDLISDNVENIISKVKGKVIFVDNANTVLNDKQRVFVSFDIDNQYILFTHSTRGFKPNRGSFATLMVQDNKGWLDFDLF